MTIETLDAIEKVITINNDIMTLLENRGVSYDNIKELFRLARSAITLED